MARVDLREKLKQGFLLLDGAMGTELFARGVEAGTCNDYLCIDSPDTVLDVHKCYVNASSGAILTNTFGANQITLSHHGHKDDVFAINSAAARIAIKAAGDTVYVLGDIGPTGEFLQPLGELSEQAMKDAFRLQAEGLVDGGVDGFIIETFTAVDELKVAIGAVRDVTDLPVFASMSYDAAGDDFRTMMGVSVEETISAIMSFDIDSIGFNCGKVSLDGYIRLAESFIKAVEKSGKDIFVSAELNAGLPELIDGKAVYRVTPEEYAQAVEKIYKLGVQILGGCCGTSPDFIRAVADVLN